jgi:putative membrane protein
MKIPQSLRDLRDGFLEFIRIDLKELVHSMGRIARTDLNLFRRFPKFIWAALAIAIVPSLYALIYLSSVWDPSAKTSALPVGVVNLDEGLHYKGGVTNVGTELTTHLRATGIFGYQTFHDEQAVRQAVRKGSLAFAVIIPRDFSANALPGLRPGDGRVTVVMSEGNNYAAASFARRFAVDLGHQVNETLNEKRWEQVLVSVDGTGKNLDKLKAGVNQLHQGTIAFDQGMERYSAAAKQLSAGFKQVGAGLRTMDSMLPPETDLKTLKEGSQRLVARQKEFGTGLVKLQTGSRQLVDGAVQMQQETAGIPFVGEKIAASAGELAAGGRLLTEGLTTALEANARLTRGSVRLETGVTKLTEGLSTLGLGLHEMALKVPEDSRLDEFSHGAEDLVRNSAKLRTGIELIKTVIPQSLDRMGGSAKGLADSVQPNLEVLAPVANNGSAFAPNMIAMALWLGAVMAVYLFNVHTLAIEHAGSPALAKTLGKFLVPALVVMSQTVLIFLMLVFGLGVAVPNFFSFSLSMLVAGLVFLAIVFLLLRAFGEIGKLIVVLLLTLQLAAGGGVIPIELSGGFFQTVHDWLPFTWVIKTFRASLFGAFDFGWYRTLLDVFASGLLALILASFVSRWNTVTLSDYKPGISI